ncbi:MAG: YbgA family protein [Pseudomonadales bacterium]
MAEFPGRPEPPLRLALSDCLLGNEVRYDGSGARSSFPHAVLSGLYQFRGICPEVGIGMPVPRPPIRLVDRDGIRAVGVARRDLDYTDALTTFAERQVAGLGDVSGYVFMKNSPSCGLFRVKVYREADGGGVSGAPGRSGRGIYAAALARALPDLPMEETGRLNDDVLRENFVMRTFAYAHWRRLLAEGLSRGRLVEFHSRYKYLLMAHSVPAYQEAGRLLSNLREDFDTKAATYFSLLMKGLAVPASRGGHANVLAHLQGYLKRVLDSDARQELAALISAYRRGEQPLLAPLALLRHHLRRYPDEYLLYQSYLDPHPEAAGLRRPL